MSKRKATKRDKLTESPADAAFDLESLASSIQSISNELSRQSYLEIVRSLSAQSHKLLVHNDLEARPPIREALSPVSRKQLLGIQSLRSPATSAVNISMSSALEAMLR